MLPRDFILAWVSREPRRCAFVCASPARYMTLVAQLDQLGDAPVTIRLDPPALLPLVTRDRAPSPLNAITIRLADQEQVLRPAERDLELCLPAALLPDVRRLLTESASRYADGTVGPRRFPLEFLPDPRLPKPRGRP